jgi:hypothetical protein
MSDNGHEPYAYNPFVSDMTARQQHQQWTEAELDILRARGKPPLATRTPGLDSTDALLEAVRHMTLQVTALRTLITALREHMGDKPSVVAFPTNALRHSR